jgi:hypothetical protein
MAGKVKMIAKERFFYGGKTVDKDQEFDADAQDVSLLSAAFRPMAMTKGKDVSPLSTKDLTPAAKPYPTAREATGKSIASKIARATGAAKYERRDMTAKED